MLSEVQLVEVILRLINGLSPEGQTLLFKLTKQTFPTSERQPNIRSIPLQYGKYRGPQLTQLEDFAIAEWRPTDEYLNSF